MTDVEVLLNNIFVVLSRGGGILLGIWAVYYFFRSLFGEAGRNPVRIVVSVMMIAAAGAIYGILPTLLDSGQNTGNQITGGGGYSMAPLNPNLDAPETTTTAPPQ